MGFKPLLAIGCLIVGFSWGLSADAITKVPAKKPVVSQQRPKTVDTKSLYNAGVIAYRMGDHAKAIANFKRVLTVDKNNVSAHYYLALSLDALNQHPEEAVPHYQYVVAHGQDPRILNHSKQRVEALQKASAKQAIGSFYKALYGSGNPAIQEAQESIAAARAQEQKASPSLEETIAWLMDKLNNQTHNIELYNGWGNGYFRIYPRQHYHVGWTTDYLVKIIISKRLQPVAWS